MSELRVRYGSVVIPEEQRAECAALSDDALRELAQGPSDQSLTYAARQESMRRIIPVVVEEMTMRAAKRLKDSF